MALNESALGQYIDREEAWLDMWGCPNPCGTEDTSWQTSQRKETWKEWLLRKPKEEIIQVNVIHRLF